MRESEKEGEREGAKQISYCSCGQFFPTFSLSASLPQWGGGIMTRAMMVTISFHLMRSQCGDKRAEKKCGG